jgi:AraC-like DNA-binding protein
MPDLSHLSLSLRRRPQLASETFLASFGLIGLRLVELHGIDPAAFASRLGLDPARPPGAGTRLPSSLLDRAFAGAIALIPDPAFALRAGECWHPSHLGTVGYAWLSSGSLQTALKRLARYIRIIGQRMSSRVVEGGDTLRYVHVTGRGDTAVGYAMADFHLALVISMCRSNWGPALLPERVTLRRPAPADPAPWQACFGCPVEFAAAEDAFSLHRQVASWPLATANHAFAVTCDALLQQQLAELRRDDLESCCRAWLLEQLTSGEPSEEDLAAAMGMSVRSLQRRLGAAGASYRALLERTRYELALRYLDDPAKSVTEITFLLGFSEQSAFSRAFKRWHGQAPSAWREARAGRA